MEKLISDFGLDGYLLVAQIVNFLIIFFILKRFAYKPLLAMLEKRRKLIEQGQKQAKEAAEALEKAIAKEKEILRNAHNESKTLLADATKQAEEIINKAHANGKKQVEGLLADAKAQITKDKQSLERELATHVASIAADMLRSSLKGIIDEKEQTTIIEKAAKQLKNAE